MKDLHYVIILLILRRGASQWIAVLQFKYALLK